MHSAVSKLRYSLNEIPLRWWITIIIAEIAIGILVSIIPSVAQPELLIIFLALIAYFGIALVRPQIALGILVFSYPIFNTNIKFIYLGETHSYLVIPSLLALIAAVALLARTGAKLHTINKHQIFLMVPVFLLAFWSAFTTIWAQNQIAPWFVSVHFIIALAVIYVTWQIIQDETILRRVLWIVFYAGLITATAIILSTILSKAEVFNYDLYAAPDLKISFQSFFYLMSERSLRAMGFGTYNQMALLMAIQLFIAGALLVTTKSRKTKWFLGFAMLYMLYAHIVTKTRAPMLGMLIGAVFAIYFLSQRVMNLKHKTIYLTTLVIIACLVLFIISALGNFDKSVSRYTSTASGVSVKDSSWTLRLTWLENSVTAFVTSYGFGVGAGNITSILYNHAPHPHDTYLHLITELGWVGVFILLTILINIIRRTTQAVRKKNISPDLQRIVIIIAGGLVAFGVSLAFEYDYFWDPTWYYLALLLAPINLALSQKLNSTTEDTVGTE
jgi:O-antigen ligase